MEPVSYKAFSKSEPNIENSPKKISLLTKNILKANNRNNILTPKNNSALSRNNFEFTFIIGKGGFGKVWRVKEKKTQELYALKEMSKTKIIDKKSEKSINGEREFLSYLHHPFIVNMHYAFQDSENLYLVMDLLTGGDLRYHCSRYRSFSEEQTRFFLACIIHSLSYIHRNNVIHRDIKPENLVLDDKGYVCITDFGVAKKNMKDNSSETSGTPGYMCPEVMNGKNHSFPADFFSIGVIGYEFMMGKRPYRGRGRKEIKEQMTNYQAKISKDEMKDGWSIEGVEFINALLERKEKKRLGYFQGVQELQEHPWLKYYPWKDLSKKILPAPFIPEDTDNFDKKYCESVDEISDETQLRYDEIALCTHFNTAFNDFYFDKNEAQRKDLNEDEDNYNDNGENTDDNDINEQEINKYKDNKNEIELNHDIEYKTVDKNIIKNQNNKNKKNTEFIIKSKDQIFAKDNNEKEFNNEKSSKNNMNSNLVEKEIELNENTTKKLNELIIKKNNNNNRKKNYILPKNSSYISLMQNGHRKDILNNINNLNHLSKNEEKKSKNDFINIKKLCINSKNAISKITNQTNNFELKDKYSSLRKKQNKINKLNNIMKINNHMQNVFNINNNEIHNINNNSNINIYLSINMFNKMLNNHLNKNKNSKDKNSINSLFNKQRQLIINENKKKSLDNYINPGQKKNYLLKNANKIKANKINRSNSVGLFLNYNIVNFGKNRNKNNYVNKFGSQ